MAVEAGTTFVDPYPSSRPPVPVPDMPPAPSQRVHREMPPDHRSGSMTPRLFKSLMARRRYCFSSFFAGFDVPMDQIHAEFPENPDRFSSSSMSKQPPSGCGAIRNAGRLHGFRIGNRHRQCAAGAITRMDAPVDTRSKSYRLGKRFSS